MTGISYYDSPLGRLLIKAEDDAICGLWFVGQKYFPERLLNAVAMNEDMAIIVSARRWLEEYFSGGRPSISQLNLGPEGSDFRRAVWEILCSIPYGQSMSYGQIARKLEAESGRKVSAQAVGGAVGHNPISIIIPCHRVLGTNSALTGYAAGLEVKTALLDLEGISYAK